MTTPLPSWARPWAADKLDVVHESELADTLAEKQQALANALEIKTAVDENFYGERLDVLTLSVPQLGSAVKTNATVYMGPPPGQTGGGKRDAAWPLCHDHSV